MDLIDLNSWWGVGAAAACGFGYRNLGAVIGYGGAAGVAVIVGACLFMLADAASG
ncbi:MAG: hypothetical protein ABIS67_00415 [Candidatus Eisenbacteria bacterium]